MFMERVMIKAGLRRRSVSPGKLQRLTLKRNTQVRTAYKSRRQGSSYCIKYLHGFLSRSQYSNLTEHGSNIKQTRRTCIKALAIFRNVSPCYFYFVLSIRTCECRFALLQASTPLSGMSNVYAYFSRRSDSSNKICFYKR